MTLMVSVLFYIPQCKHSTTLPQMSSSPGIVRSLSVTRHHAHSLTTLQSAFPKHDGNLFEWVGTIEGPAETVGFVYVFSDRRAHPTCQDLRRT